MVRQHEEVDPPTWPPAVAGGDAVPKAIGIVVLVEVAGGEPLLHAFLRRLPSKTGYAFVLLREAPQGENAPPLPSQGGLLVRDGDEVRPDRLHVLPTSCSARVERNRFVLTKTGESPLSKRMREFAGAVADFGGLVLVLEEVAPERIHARAEHLVGRVLESRLRTAVGVQEAARLALDDAATKIAALELEVREQDGIAADMEHLLQTCEIGTLFLDSALRVRRFASAIGRAIPLQPGDLGRPLASLRHRLLDVEPARIAETVLRGMAGIERQVRTIDDATLLLRAVPYFDRRDRLGGVVMTLVDVSAIAAARSELAEKEKRFRQVAENIDEVIWIREQKTGEFLYLSPVAELLWGRPTEDLVRNRTLWLHTVHSEDRDRVRGGYAEGIAAGAFSLEYRIVRGDGEVRWVRDRGFPITDDDNLVIRIAGIVTDITSSKLTEEQLRSTAQSMRTLAHRDALTGLANRRGWELHLQEAAMRARLAGEEICCVIVDCDDFKRVNDDHGHSAGDQVLREIATRLARAIRPSDFLARIGGDEFLVLLPTTRPAEALRVAERMRAAVAETSLWIGERELRVTVSMGVGTVPNSVASSEAVLTELHRGLSRSKHGGKNRVGTSRGDGARIDRPEELANLLRSESAFRVFAQAIHRVSDEGLAGYEFLTRGPKGDAESPEAFFRIAAEHDMLTLVDTHCLRLGLRAATATPAAGTRMHFNIHPATLLALSESALQELFAPARALDSCCLEISEQLFLGQPDQIGARLREVRALGVRIAIDDVGFGRSSLESLLVLEPDVLKIDRAFVSGASSDPAKRARLSRLLRLAHSLEAEVVAEGVETRADAALLRELGVPFAQGFLWDRPAPYGVTITPEG